MNTKISSILVALFVCTGIAFPGNIRKVKIGDHYYNLDMDNKTAEVTSENDKDPYWSWSRTIEHEYIPSSLSWGSYTYRVTGIGKNAFRQCYQLKSVTLPNSIVYIGEGAFDGCMELISINIPNGVTNIGNRAFEVCTKLPSLKLPESVTTIGDSAFLECLSMTEFVIPANVKHIGKDAFSEMPNVICKESAVSSVKNARCVNGFTDGWLVYRDSSKKELMACSASASGEITIPNTVTSIGKNAFYYCQDITSVIIPNSVQIVGMGAFSYCKNLSSVTISNSTTSIEKFTFRECSSLTSIRIPESIQYIDKYAFLECSGLREIHYPNGFLDLSGITFPSTAALIPYNRAKPFYFSDFAKPRVEKAINEWQVKDEFEKTADWQKRVNETTRNAKIKELTKQAEEDYLKVCTETLKPDISLSGIYDADNEVFLLSEPQFGNMIVAVSISEARAFKQNWSSVKITPKYFIENDVLALSSLDIYFPSLNKHYTYSNQASLKYEQAQVDYNFAPIDIAAGGNAVQKGQQTIGQKKIAAGKSQVDLQIPETNASNQNTFVIIIANEDYKSVAPVPFAINDGRVLAKYCQRTLGIPAANIKVHENATYNDLRLAVAWLKNVCEKYEGEASVIFYYTGHGIPDESDKSAYLLPVDGDGRYVATGYKIDDLYQKLGEMPTKSVTVLLDACFSGATRDGKMISQAKGVAVKVRGGFPQGNTVAISAAQGDETAGFNEEEGHGMFTYYLLKKLQETQGDVTLQDLSQYIIREVGRKSAVTNKPQTPCVTPSVTLSDEWQNWKLK